VCCIFFFRTLVRTLEILVEICANGQEQLRLPPSASFTNVPALHTKIYVLQLQWLTAPTATSLPRHINSNDWFNCYQVSGIRSNQNFIMSKKLFLNREKVIPTAQAPSVSREEPESEVASSSRYIPVSGISEQLPFLLLDETSKSFAKLNATGRSLLIKFRPPLNT